MPEIIRIATVREGGSVLLWIAADNERAASDHAKKLSLWPSKSRWCGPGNYRSDVYMVEARSTVPREAGL